MNLFVSILLLLWILRYPSRLEGQRLSQGASDWYMRFRGISMVKRHFDDPITYRYHVVSEIRHRYAITEVKSTIYNPGTAHQVYRFGLVMPKTAFVSGVTLRRQNQTLYSVPEQRETYWSKTNGRRDGSDTTHHHETTHDPIMENQESPYYQLLRGQQYDKFQMDLADFQQFILPINLRPHENVTVELVYEDIIVRRFDQYTLSLSVSPGSIVEDFQLDLSISESRPLRNVSVTAPVIGEIVPLPSEDPNYRRILFNMTRLQQFDYFGRHGITGQFKVEYNIEPVSDGRPDVVIKDNHFVHFYYQTSEELPSIPKHVIILLDISESMSGPKLVHAKESIRLLLRTLNDNDYTNVLLFNETVYEWHPNYEFRSDLVVEEAFPCHVNITNTIEEFLRPVQPSGKSDLVGAIVRGMDLDKRLWLSDSLPENAHTMMVLVTDGRSPSNQSESHRIRDSIRKANQLSQIPILILGMGFDANMDLLENVADKSDGYAENVIEDVDVEPQLRRISFYLNDVVLKNLALHYIGDRIFDRRYVTQSQFRYFHSGSSIVVTGRFHPDRYLELYPEFEVEITGQSAEGLYMEHPYSFPLESETETCDGNLTLCSETELRGKCVTLNNSRANLIQYGFGNRAASSNVTGNCVWLVYSEAYYSGKNLTWISGTYPTIPGMHRDISSVKRVPSLTPTVRKNSREIPETSVARMWAFMTIKHVFQRLMDRPERVQVEEILRASDLANRYHFMTPFTDLRLTSMSNEVDDETDFLVEPNKETFVDNDLLTYKDLSPVLNSLKDPMIARQWQSLESCHPPVKCLGNFHLEELTPIVERNEDEKCVGSITLFTKPGYDGEHLEIRNSVFQLYHSVNSQRFRSVSSEGTCCWLVFDKRFFAGDVEKICGKTGTTLRMKNIGSIKQIGKIQSSIIK